MIRFILLAGGSFAESVSSPLHPLQPLGGHNPMICILLTTLCSIQIHEEYSIHLLVRKDQEESFQKTIGMWFPEQTIHIHGCSHDFSSDALRDFFSKKAKTWEQETACVVFPSHHILLSRMTIEHFVAYASSRDFATVGIKKSKWNQERHLYNLYVNSVSLRVEEINNEPFDKVGWIPLQWGKKYLWEQYLPFTQRVRDIVAILPIEKKPLLYLLHSFPLETDSLCIHNEDDKVLASHKFLEKHHADYLNQCYFIWSECKRLEERIDVLDKTIKNLQSSL